MFYNYDNSTQSGEKNMKNTNQIFANNLVRLRKQKNLTQLELAERLSYSDRNISKWENAQSLPPLEVANEIAKYFEVSVDYLLNEHTDEELNGSASDKKKNFLKKVLILGLSLACAMAIAFVCMVVLFTVFEGDNRMWSILFLSLPLMSLLGVILTPIFFPKKKVLFVFMSILTWTALVSGFLMTLLFADINIWYLILVGVPLQIAIVMWSSLPYYSWR